MHIFLVNFFTTVCGVSTCGLIYRIISRLMPIVQATKTPDTSKCTFRVKKIPSRISVSSYAFSQRKIGFYFKNTCILNFWRPPKSDESKLTFNEECKNCYCWSELKLLNVPRLYLHTYVRGWLWWGVKIVAITWSPERLQRSTNTIFALHPLSLSKALIVPQDVLGLSALFWSGKSYVSKGLSE